MLARGDGVRGETARAAHVGGAASSRSEIAQSSGILLEEVPRVDRLGRLPGAVGRAHADVDGSTGWR